MRTQQRLVCECGHEGYLCLAENDQPYSTLWESYTLDGFSGGSLVITSYEEKPKDLLAALQPKCSDCGQTGKVKYK
jgi:hypothetical protein